MTGTVLKAPTAKQLDAQRQHVVRAQKALRRALRVADGPLDTHVMRALIEVSDYLKATR